MFKMDELVTNWKTNEFGIVVTVTTNTDGQKSAGVADPEDLMKYEKGQKKLRFKWNKMQHLVRG